MNAKREVSRTGIVFAVAAMFCLAVAAGAAQAGDVSGSQERQLRIDVAAQTFVVRGEDVYARGPAVASFIDPDGSVKTVRKRVRLEVETTTKCKILKLHLAPLYLNLLGLQARTSHINLRITGDPNRTLGKLFCSLSRGVELDDEALKRRTTKSLNRQLSKRPLPVLSLEVPVRAKQQPASAGGGMASASQVPPVPAGSCEVLNLFLGPLNLDLLGLIVDLHGQTPEDPVTVLVTADPNAGLLGKLLCEVLVPPPA